MQAVDAQLGCTQKLVTTVALPSTGSLATEQLQYTVPCVGRWVGAANSWPSGLRDEHHVAQHWIHGSGAVSDH
jgi:hypothetical protein